MGTTLVSCQGIFFEEIVLAVVGMKKPMTEFVCDGESDSGRIIDETVPKNRAVFTHPHEAPIESRKLHCTNF